VNENDRLEECESLRVDRSPKDRRDVVRGKEMKSRCGSEKGAAGCKAPCRKQ